jgi:aminoglycoside 6-adenylyltransferase
MKHIQQEKLPSQMAAQLATAFGRGMPVLLDKDKMLTDLQKLIPPPTKTSPQMPTQDEFLEVVNDFLHHTIWTAKHLLRGELWWADTCCNCRLSQLMLTMMEWHAKAKHGWKYDTWFRGRFLEQWTDQQVLEELKSTFTHYDKQDTGKALMAALGLFCRMATEVAEKLSCHYPEEEDRRIIDWLQSQL